MWCFCKKTTEKKSPSILQANQYHLEVKSRLTVTTLVFFPLFLTFLDDVDVEDDEALNIELMSKSILVVNVRMLTKQQLPLYLHGLD